MNTSVFRDSTSSVLTPLRHQAQVQPDRPGLDHPLTAASLGRSFPSGCLGSHHPHRPPEEMTDLSLGSLAPSCRDAALAKVLVCGPVCISRWVLVPAIASQASGRTGMSIHANPMFTPP